MGDYRQGEKAEKLKRRHADTLTWFQSGQLEG
jgi:hypothetical protein